MKVTCKARLATTSIVAMFLLCTNAFAQQYTLEGAIAKAQMIDPWLDGSKKQQQSLDALGVQAGSMPDPTVSLSLANLPVDSFEFSQEGMTQFKIGVTQMFPRGKTRALQREKFNQLSKTQSFAREERLARIAVSVSHAWLEVYRQKRTIELIQNDRGLFEHLVDLAQSHYTSAIGKVRQQNLVRAQLELTAIDDRLIRLHQMYDSQLAHLGEWISTDEGRLAIADATPISLKLTEPALLYQMDASQRTRHLSERLSTHPIIRGINQNVAVSQTNIALANQSYKPQWAINASYGYRDQDPMGQDRADFFSAGVSFDLPLFTGNRQDKQVKSATAEREKIKTDRALALRKLRSGFYGAEANYLRLLERKSLFDTRLLMQMAEQSESSLNAYTNDNGDFSEVVRARIAELNAHIDALNIEVDIFKSIAQLNYFLVGATFASNSGDAHE